MHGHLACIDYRYIFSPDYQLIKSWLQHVYVVKVVACCCGEGCKWWLVVGVKTVLVVRCGVLAYQDSVASVKGAAAEALRVINVRPAGRTN